MIELVAFFVFIISFFVLIFNNVRLNLRLSELKLELIKAHLDKTIISEKLIKIVNEKNKEKDSSSEAFLKFISDSRDWAYQYIEEVQLGLDKFINDVKPEIDYFDEYGVVGSAYPHYHSMKKISTAYKELKNLLPDDYGKIDV